VITAAEKSAIIDWIANGTPAGDTSLAPAPPVFSHYQLQGTPDLELSIPSFTSNAGASDSYNCFSLPTGLIEDRIVRAYEIVAGNSSIVHHVVAVIDTLGTSVSDLSGSCYSPPSDIKLGAYAPGSEPTIFPSTGPLKMGITLKAGSNIILNIHYEAGTAGLTDNTKIRLYFYPQGTANVRKVHIDKFLHNCSMNVPPEFIRTYYDWFPNTGSLLTPISIFAAFPHSHKIATQIKNCATNGTDTIPLIKINDWDFNWQGFYTYENLVKIPAGYYLYGSHTFDNTSSNPNNPHYPPIEVNCGYNSDDEMFVDVFQWLDYLPGDELINIDSLINSDPLITGISNSNSSASNTLFASAYPNPFQNTVNISYSLNVPGNTRIDIYDMLGTLIQSIERTKENAGIQNITWEGKDREGKSLAAGTYFYSIHSGTDQGSGKLMLIK
jgi:hypothetical protein